LNPKSVSLAIASIICLCNNSFVQTLFFGENVAILMYSFCVITLIYWSSSE